MKSRFVLILPALALAACTAGVGTTTGPAASSTGGAQESAATKVTLASSGADSCGAVDFAFLTGQPFAHTFDINLPAGTRYFGRSERPDALNNPRRLNVNVSTRQAFHAHTDGDAKIVKVYCG